MIEERKVPQVKTPLPIPGPRLGGVWGWQEKRGLVQVRVVAVQRGG